jgi:hypothetical protein
MAEIVAGVVVRVVVADSAQWCVDNFGGIWVETADPYIDLAEDGGVPVRRNYAGIGYTFDEERDAFIAPKPDGDWVLNEVSCLWERPADWVEPEPEPPTD